MKKRFMSVICIIITLITVLSSGVVANASPYYNGAPNVYINEVSYTSVKLQWNEYRDSTYQFLIYRSPTGKKGTWTKLATTGVGATSYTDKTIVPNQTYFYTVKSYKYFPGSKTKMISEMSTVWQVSTQLPRPDFSLVGNSGKGVLLKWDMDKEMNGVVIYRSLSGKAGTWSKIKIINNNKTKSYTDTKVNIGETYYYCYKVFKTVNGKNYYSQSSKAYKSTILDVSVPQNLQAIPREDGIMVKYSKSYGTIGYMIYRSETGKAGSWTRLCVTKSNNTLSYLDKTAVAGKTYYYTVKSYKTVNGKSYYSNPAKAVKVVNDVAPPELSFVTGDSITFTDYYEEIPVTLAFKNINNEDNLKIYIDGFEIKDDYSDEEALKLLSECKFLFDVDEEKTTDEELSMIIYRLKPGTGKLKVEYNGVSAELTVNCGEFEYDKEAEKVNENYAKAMELSYDALVLIADGIDSGKRETIVQKGQKAYTKVCESRKYLEEAQNILESHRAEFIKYDRFKEEVKLIEDAIKAVDSAIVELEDIENDTEILESMEDAFNALYNYFNSLI